MLARSPNRFRAGLPAASLKEVVCGGLDRGNAATLAENEYSRTKPLDKKVIPF
jgi:hypothetical protein